ncbi:hypothetical protein [Nocardioides sp. LHG3406-4]|uniref:hypothetical protein n=1 Tax=Nocardioides sp. LHG3406-4 TaxID=2804575 RepID=UPI003CEBFA50
MDGSSGIRWGRWAAFAGGVLLLRGVLRGASGALALAGDEALYRAVGAVRTRDARHVPR